MMKIYTRTGDRGKTGLFGGSRISKSDLRLHAYGTVDELNAGMGLILAEDLTDARRDEFVCIQRLLFCVGSDLATPMASTSKIERLTGACAKDLERWIDAMDASLPPLTQFILPGGSRTAALLHAARTTCRRAERWIVQLAEREPINPEIIVFMNRLSDYLFTAARFENMVQSIGDTIA